MIVLRHEGPTFCSGADLKERSDPNAPPDSRPMVDALERLMDSPCPTIAAVQGSVRAGGVGLVAACDLSVVAPSVTFALTEVRIGVAAAVISVPILRRVTPAKIAVPMLTGEPFDTEFAREIGLVTHVSDDVQGTVDTLCEAVMAGAPRAIAGDQAPAAGRAHARSQHGLRRDACAQRRAVPRRRRRRGHGRLPREAHAGLADALHLTADG